MLLNLSPQHPSTHGVSRLISIIYGEIIQWIRSELGLSHRGSEKLIDCNYYNTSINYFDRLDYVSTIIQELLYVGGLERFIQSYSCLFSSLFRILYIEIFRILNHCLALTTHVIDIGLFTCFPWGSEEREKLINYVESVSGSRFHNASLSINNIKSDFENPSIGILLFLILFLFIKFKELSYILSTISLSISRLYHVGIIDRSLVYYFGLSGVILRASYLYFDGRFMNYESYNILDYNIFISMNSDCLDRFMIRINESMNSSLMVYIIIYLVLFYDSVIYSLSIMQSIISFYLSSGLFSSSGCILSYSQSIKFFLESSKGIYVIFLSNYYLWSTNIISNDYMMINQSNSYCRVYNLGDLIAILGSVDFVLGSVDLG